MNSRISQSAPIERLSLGAQAAALILQRIQDGEWGLGHKLPGETTLAAQLGVGRSTIREAIRELAGKGVLEPRQGVGVFITALEVTEDWETVVRRSSITAVLEARIAIETEAAALAAQRRGISDLRALRRTLTARREVDPQNHEVYVDADMALHRAVVTASHNAILLELFDGFIPAIRRAMLDMLRAHPKAHDSGSNDHEAHADLVEAIANKDAVVAAQVSRTHLSALLEALQ